MGGQTSYLASGGFSKYLYHQIGEIISADGVSGKILKKEGDEHAHDGLPMYSNTSKVYFKLDDETTTIEQARIYDGRKVILDFDWGHNHRDFIEGTVHVHEWRTNKKGKWVRSRNPRLLYDDEIKRFGELLKKAFPSIRFT